MFTGTTLILHNGMQNAVGLRPTNIFSHLGNLLPENS